MALPSPSESSAALVTGASSGIGTEFARQLAVAGHNVILVARRRDRLENLAAELAETGAQAEVLPADLAEPAARDALATGVEALGLDVSVLVNCAGFGVYAAFTDSPRERELEQARVLVEAVVDLTHRYLPGMVSRGAGAVITVSSSSGFQASPYNAGYAAAKSHALLFSEALHGELKGTGVTATAVCPGPVGTEFQAQSDAAFAEKVPKIVWVSSERVASEGLKAAGKGRRVVVPGNLLTKAFFHPNRMLPTAITNPVVGRLMKG